MLLEQHMLWSMDKTCFDQLVRNKLRTYDNIQKIATYQRDS